MAFLKEMFFGNIFSVFNVDYKFENIKKFVQFLRKTSLSLDVPILNKKELKKENFPIFIQIRKNYFFYDSLSLPYSQFEGEINYEKNSLRITGKIFPRSSTHKAIKIFSWVILLMFILNMFLNLFFLLKIGVNPEQGALLFTILSFVVWLLLLLFLGGFAYLVHMVEKRRATFIIQQIKAAISFSELKN